MNSMEGQHPDQVPLPQDLAGMEALYQQYAPVLYLYLTRHVSREEDAEDLLVDVFLAALENKQFANLPEKTQLAWLWSVVRHKIIDSYRHSRRWRQRLVMLGSLVETPLRDESVDPEDSALRQEEYGMLHSSIRRLTPFQQELLHLRFAQNMRCSEIAACLGKREGAVKVMLSRTLNALKRFYSL